MVAEITDESHSVRVSVHVNMIDLFAVKVDHCAR